MKTLIVSAIAVLLVVSPNAFAQKGGVAVLDIDKVAQDLKVDQSVLLELKGIENQLNTELAQIRQNLQNRMTQLEAQAGQQRTQQIQQQLVSANQQLNQQFNTVKSQAQNQLVAERVKKINEFRDKLEPIAKEVAASKGLDVVLTKTPQLFAFAEAVDITEEVIAKAKAAGLEANIPVPSIQVEPPSGNQGSPKGKGKAKEAAQPQTSPAPAPAPAPAAPTNN